MTTIRGCAVPFSRARHIALENIVEVIAPKAFTKFCASSPKVGVWWSSHIGKKIADVTRLFEGDDGLYFECEINDNGIVSSIVQGRTSQCSVSFVKRDITIDHENGFERVTEAAIDHIAITDGADYPSTACWNADADARLDLAPQRIRDMAERWEIASEHHVKARDVQTFPMNSMLNYLAHTPIAMTKESRGRLNALMRGQLWTR